MMIEGRENFRLPLEPADPLMIAAEFIGKNLDGHVALQPGIASAVNLAHPAFAQQRKDFKRAQLCAGCQRHLPRI